MTGDLIEAVDLLTLPMPMRVSQWWTDGPQCTDSCPKGREHEHVTRIEHDPLLHQLEAAIASTIGGAGRGVAALWNRNVLDSDALMRFSAIAAAVKSLCLSAGVPASGHPSENLRRWYVARLTLSEDERANDAGHAAVFRGWARTIQSKLDPLRSREFLDPCPACGADTWVDGEGATYRHPITIQYRVGDPDDTKDRTLLAHANLDTARATCRVCQALWEGELGIRSLDWEAKQHAAAHAESGLECAGLVDTREDAS